MRRGLAGVIAVAFLTGVAAVVLVGAASQTAAAPPVKHDVGRAEVAPVDDQVVAATADPRRMVLRLSDLPAGFALDRGYYAGNARAAQESQTPLALLIHWGRINGYAAVFSRSGSTGILQAKSAASTYKTAKGAMDSTHDAFSAQERSFERVPIGTKIGSEARMYSVKSQGASVIGYGLFWRSGAVKAGLVVAGWSGSVAAADVVKLAQRQQARIEAATTRVRAAVAG